VPEEKLTCDGLISPIEPLIVQLVVNKKQEWVQKLEQYIVTISKRWVYDFLASSYALRVMNQEQ
jgi:hypothetical protein